jgi:hypothetical protein
MREEKGNIFTRDCDVLCITTNGFTKASGEAVMGSGCALQAAKYIPSLPIILGASLKVNGNRVSLLLGNMLASFPVKPVSIILEDKSQVVRHMQDKFDIGQFVPVWACVADLELIRQSAIQLEKMNTDNGWETVVLPRPGCGAGELSWDIVKPVLDDILDDMFICMTF